MNNLPFKTGHLFIAAAILMGILTMVLFTTLSKPAKPAKRQVAQVETRNVVVPLVPIVKGETIGLDKLKVVKWPKDFLPEGATFQNPAYLIGRTPLQDLLPGEPIFAQKLSGSQSGGLPALIPAGRRAVTISVSEVKGVAGFVKPGDHVDVLSTFQMAKKGDDGNKVKYYRTVTVLQDVLVLASAQTMVEDKQYNIPTPAGVTEGEAAVKQQDEASAEDEKGAKKDRRKKEKEKEKAEEKEKSDKDLEKERKKAEKDRRDAEKRAKLVSSVTLAVTPEQAQALTTAEQAGELRLALRSDTDLQATELTATESDDVIFGDKKKSAPPPMPKFTPPPAPMLPPQGVSFGNAVELIEGTNKTSVNF